MPASDIHWKGYPHNCLPRIRLSSPPPSSIHSSSTSRVPTRPIAHLPANSALEVTRRKQQAQRRRAPKRSVSSGAAVRARARRRASQTARQNIHIFGWVSPRAALTNSTPSLIRKKAVLDSPSQLQSPTTANSLASHPDGALNSNIQSLAAKEPQEPLTAVRVTETSIYWGDKKVQYPSKPETAGEYVHSWALRTNNKPGAKVLPGESRNYDSRIRYRLNGHRVDTEEAQVTAKENRPLGDIALLDSWETPTTQSELSPPPEAAPSTTSLRRTSSKSIQSLVQSIVSKAPSRTPSQRRALRQFIKELEFCLQILRLGPNQTPLSSSSSTVSAHTIRQLKPYQAEFEAAGLAVTSAEQRRKTYKTLPSIISTATFQALRPSHFAIQTTGLAVTPTKQPTRTSLPLSTSIHTIQELKPYQAEFQKAGLAVTSVDQRPKSYKSPRDPSKDDMFSRKPTAKSAARLSRFPKATEKKQQANQDPTSNNSDDSSVYIGWTDDHEGYDRQEYRHPPQTTMQSSRSSKGKQPERSMSIAARKRSLPWLRRQEETAKNFHASNNNGNSAVAILDRVPTKKSLDGPPSDLSSEPDSVSSSIVLHLETPPEHKKPELAYIAPVVKKTTFREIGTTGAPRSNNDDPTHPRPTESQTYIQDRTAPQSKSASRSVAKGPKEPQATSDHPPAPPPNFPRQTALRQNDVHDDVQVASTYPQGSAMQPQEIQTFSSDDRQPRSFMENTPTSRSTPKRAAPTLSNGQPENMIQSGSAVRPPSQDPERGRNSRLSNRSSTATLRPANPARLPPPPPKCISCGGELVALLPADRQPARERLHETVAQAPPSSGLIHECHRSSSQCEKCAPPVPDPVKKLAVREADMSSKRRKLEALSESSNVNGMPDASSKKYASVPLAPFVGEDKSTALVSSASVTTASTASIKARSRAKNDQKVFRGLHVATAAACDEDIDKWVQEITGTSVRKLLASLSAFDGLGVATLAGVAKRAAKQRRNEVKAWESIRERMLEEAKFGADGKASSAGAGDFVNTSKQAIREKQKLVLEMLKTKDADKVEGMRDRALKMGWRGRSVSGQF